MNVIIIIIIIIINDFPSRIFNTCKRLSQALIVPSVNLVGKKVK